MAEQFPGATYPVPTASGTVQQAQSFNPEAAAEALRKAMKGLGTNEDAIIKVLATHCNAQRAQIEAKFKVMFGRDLRSDLKSELGGKFEDICLALLDPPRVYDAKVCHEAIKGLGTDECALIEVLVPKSNTEIAEIKHHYKHMFKKDLEADIIGDTGGDFKRLLVALSTGNREDRPEVNHTLAGQEADQLLKAGELKWGTDESTFTRILCLRSPPQLYETFQVYKAKSGKDIEQSIKTEMSGSLEKGALAIVKCVKSPAKFFAEQLHDSMAGLGTNDKALIRQVVSRSEIDMKDIKKEFIALYKTNLTDFIKGDTSGDYKKILLQLIA